MTEQPVAVAQAQASPAAQFAEKVGIGLIGSSLPTLVAGAMTGNGALIGVGAVLMGIGFMTAGGASDEMSGLQNKPEEWPDALRRPSARMTAGQ